MRALPVNVLMLATAIATLACVHPPVAKNGMTVEQAQHASLLLAPGMTRKQVLEVLGEPTDAESTTAGSSTDHPWQALVWNYRWASNGYDQKRLTLFFAEPEAAVADWLLNNWHWF